MKKIRKFCALLSVCLLTLSLLAACTPQEETTTAPSTGNDEPTAPEKVTYTIQVLYPDETPAANVTLRMTQGGVQVAEATTDFMGQVKCELEADFYTIKLVADTIPSGYVYELSDIRTDNETLEYTVVLQKSCNHKYVNYLCTKCGRYQPYTVFNPEQIYIGATTTITLDKKRVDDAENADDPYSCTSQDDSMFYFAVTPFKPEHVGHYKLTVTGAPEGVTLFLGHYTSSASYTSFTPKKSDTGNAPSLEFNMERRYMIDSEGNWVYRNNWLFGVRVEGETDAYPIELHVTLEWERDLVAGQDYEITDRYTVKMEDGAKNAQDVLGDVSGKKLVTIVSEYSVKDEDYGKYPVAKDIDVVLGEDGYYHIGAKDGAILTVDLKNPNAIFNGDESFISVNAASGVENLIVSKVIGSMHYEVYYYESMLVEYAALCNDDGVYPVNEQLYNFLKEWVNQRVGSGITGSLDEDHAFLLACSFYTDK